MSKGAKTAIVIGGAAFVAGVAAYGIYKYNKAGGFSSSTILRGRDAVKELGSGDIEIPKKVFDTAKADAIDPKKILPRLQKPESIDDVCKSIDSVQNAFATQGNPNRGDPDYRNNCVRTSLTAFLRTNGIDVTPTNNHGKDIKLSEALEEVFPGIMDNDRRYRQVPCKQWTGSDSAKNSIMRVIGKDVNHAEGVISIPRRRGDGKKLANHAFNWIFDNGSISFFDCQQSNASSLLESNVFAVLDKSGGLDGNAIIARLDGMEISDGVRKHVG